MTNIDLDDDIYKDWVVFWRTHDQIEYPTLKNFTAKKLRELIKK